MQSEDGLWVKSHRNTKDTRVFWKIKRKTNWRITLLFSIRLDRYRYFLIDIGIHKTFSLFLLYLKKNYKGESFLPWYYWQRGDNLCTKQHSSASLRLRRRTCHWRKLGTMEAKIKRPSHFVRMSQTRETTLCHRCVSSLNKRQRRARRTDGQAAGSSPRIDSSAHKSECSLLL